MLINFDKICRLCMMRNKTMVSLFEDESLNLTKKIMILIPALKIYAGDNLPSQVCQECVDQVNNFDNFKLQCEKSDVVLNKYLNYQHEENENAERHGTWKSIQDDMTSEASISVGLQNDCKIEEELENKLHYEVKEEHITEECNIEITSIPLFGHSIRNENSVKGDRGINRFSRTRKSKLTEKTIPCYVCGKILIYRRRNEHIRKHVEGRTLKCNKCGKMFSEKGDLKKHFLVHSELRSQMCDVCGKRFKLLSNLKVHRATHTGQKSHVCDVCGKRFTQLGSLKLHNLIHMGIKPYSCDICGKNYTQKVSLKIHLAIHAGQKQHECEICGKSFVRKGHLLTHMTVHTGEKKYCCEVCGMSYTQRHNLKKHKRKHEAL